MKTQIKIAPYFAIAVGTILSFSPTAMAGESGAQQHGAKASALKASAFKVSASTVSQPRAKTMTFSIAKMHCEGCASGLEQAAKSWPGVRSVEVSFAQKRALVTFDPKKTSPAKIAQEFARVGFPAKVVQ